MVTKAIGLTSPIQMQPTTFTKLAPASQTEVYDTFWKFAAERQEIFFQKWRGSPPPWTDDDIMCKYKFTNAYRASDRVSQFLIRHVIYDGDQSSEEVFFRTILFKLFNKIDTWKILHAGLGTICYEEYSFERYDRILTEALLSRIPIYSAAYIMPSGTSSFGHRFKHRNHLQLLECMLLDEVPKRITNSSSLKQVFELLRCYPMIGDFLAYQYAIDLNYSVIVDFSEMEFVVAGPGAVDGVHKCFSDLGGISETEIIHLVVERQEKEFNERDLSFQSLWERPLQLIDCQNLFCEVSKYARLKHPKIIGTNGRTRIKQFYRPSTSPLEYWFPPKWSINHLISQSGGLE